MLTVYFIFIHPLIVWSCCLGDAPCVSSINMFFFAAFESKHETLTLDDS